MIKIDCFIIKVSDFYLENMLLIENWLVKEEGRCIKNE